MWNRNNGSAPAQSEIRSRIGASTSINGQIESKEDLYIDGNVRGEIIDAESCRLVLGPHARVTANTRAHDVLVLGQLKGDVEASGKTSVGRRGSLIGDIRTAGVLIEEEAFFRGKIEIISNTPAPDATPDMIAQGPGISR
jgi:cytoskeletal protein CcmA (bactofilin family)